MHQIRFRLGLCPRPRAPPDPLAGFKGPTSKGREGEGREGKGREGKGEGGGKGRAREGRGREYNVSRILAAACWQPYWETLPCAKFC